MNLGIIHYNTPGGSLEAFLDYAAETGFEAVELQSADVWPADCDNPEKQAEAARKMVETRGMVVSALAAQNDFVVVEPQVISYQVERMERIGRLAQILGTNIIRSEGGARKDEVALEDEPNAMIECFKRCGEFMERDGVLLALDNHGFVTNDAELELRIFEKVGSPNLGANLDTMNYRWMGHSIETCNRFYDLIAPRTFHVHLKDGTGSIEKYVGSVLGDGELDVAYSVQALQKAGYNGTYCAEWEGKGESATGYAGCLQWMKKNIQK